MLNESRIDIYDYIYGLLNGVVTENVYYMNEPQELTTSDTSDGFIVITVGNIVDESEFYSDAYGRVRCFIQAFIPPTSRGRVDRAKYKSFEDGINTIINLASEDGDGEYYIERDSVLSLDSFDASSPDNVFFTFVKSFIVVIDKHE